MLLSNVITQQSGVKLKSVPFNEMNRKFELKVLHRSENFLAIDKDFDLVMNDDDPERFTLASLIKRDLPGLYNHKYAVSIICCPLQSRS